MLIPEEQFFVRGNHIFNPVSYNNIYTNLYLEKYEQNTCDQYIDAYILFPFRLPKL